MKFIKPIEGLLLVALLTACNDASQNEQKAQEANDPPQQNSRSEFRLPDQKELNYFRLKPKDLVSSEDD